MRDPLPILITVPHGGQQVPRCVADRLALSESDLEFFSDPAACDLYDYRDRVAAWLGFRVSRMVVDVNRSPFDLPPRRADGVVKSRAIDGQHVYRTGQTPSIAEIHRLMMRYYFPFHEEVDRLLDERGVRMAFDCHTMLDRGPPFSPDAGKNRPLICLGNHGDPEGEPRQHQLATCPAPWIRRLAEVFEEEFPGGKIAINLPYRGGFTSIAHFWHRGVPYVQIEVNRSLYESEGSGADTGRVGDVRERVWRAISAFWEEVGGE